MEETDINDSFLESAVPSRSDVEQVLTALQDEPRGLSINDLTARVNARRGRIVKALQLLSLESPAPLVRQGTRWVLTRANLADSFWERAERLTSLRRVEQQQMLDYVALKSGHMEFLIHALDGDPGRFEPPNLPALPTGANPALVGEAIGFLRDASLEIEPRKLTRFPRTT